VSILPSTDDQRIPEHGRIRWSQHKTGQGKGSRAGKAMDTFRFTSRDQAAVEQIAAWLGGEPQPWNDQWEVFTPAHSFEVWLPPTADACIEQAGELWEGGGCMRKCDGETMRIPTKTGWGHEPCRCVAANARECDLVTRMRVILPGIRFGGVWRLETRSEIAWSELPGMVNMILGMQAQTGMPVAELALRNEQSRGGQRKFVVPTLRMTASPVEIMSGGATATAISAGDTADDRPALGRAHDLVTHDDPPPKAGYQEATVLEPEPEDDIADAEIIEEVAEQAATGEARYFSTAREAHEAGMTEVARNPEPTGSHDKWIGVPA
jgi:hypothetical protein